MVITSIKPNKEFLNGPFALPIAPTLEPYRNVWEGLNFGVLMQNSLLYATTGSALAVALALVPAFALSRFEIPWQEIRLRAASDRPHPAAANRAHPAL